MKDLIKIVFLLIAGGCFGIISWFTFINPVLTTEQFVSMVYAGIGLLAILAILYTCYKLAKG